MITQDLSIERAQLNKLLAAASGDAALLYIYLKSGNDPEQAEKELRIPQTRLSCAMATLRQLGLWQPAQKHIVAGERPNYTETDVMSAMDTDRDFRAIYGEIQRTLGRTLNTEELKIVLGFTRYLGLPGDVICVLVCYCKERNRQRGNLRNPSLRTIEKEAYAWADRGITTIEDAAAFIQNQNQRNSQLGQLKQQLQIHGRNLTQGEERFAAQWLEMGFDKEAIDMAYDRTCVNTGGFSWSYMNRILTRWHEAGLHTGQEVLQKDREPDIAKGASGKLGQAELDAIQRILKED